MGKLLCEKKIGTFGVEMRDCGQKLVKFCTLTHAAKLVVEICTARQVSKTGFCNLPLKYFMQRHAYRKGSMINFEFRSNTSYYFIIIQ